MPALESPSPKLPKSGHSAPAGTSGSFLYEVSQKKSSSRFREHADFSAVEELKFEVRFRLFNVSV